VAQLHRCRHITRRSLALNLLFNIPQRRSECGGKRRHRAFASAKTETTSGAFAALPQLVDRDEATEAAHS